MSLPELGSKVPPRLDGGARRGSHRLPGSCIHRSSFFLQVANGRVQSLEATVEKLLTSESKLKQATLALELERSALLQTVEQLQRQMAALGSRESDPTLPKPSGD